MLYIIVQICCGSWGDVEMPKTLASVQSYAESMVVIKPISSWFFQLLEMLHEVEDSMLVTALRVRGFTVVLTINPLVLD